MADKRIPFGKPMREQFRFAPSYTPINNGSYGTSPKAVKQALEQHQADLEAKPDWYIRYEYPRLLNKSRQATAKLLNAHVDDVVFVQNASTAYNTVLRSLVWKEDDYVLYYDTIYGSLHKVIKYLEETTPLRSKRIDVQFPSTDDEIVSKLGAVAKEVKAAGHNPRMAVFDTIASMPGLRMPFERMTQKCRDLGIMSLVDGAHGIGHIPLDLKTLDADFFTSNLHKWLFVPRGCAVLHVPQRNQHLIRSSLPTPHEFKPKDIDMPGIFPTLTTPFVALFQFIGTVDSQNYLTVPEALKFREEVCGGEDAIREYCFQLARDGGKRVAEILETEVMCDPEDNARQCAMVNVRLPIESGKATGQLRPEHQRVAYEFITHESTVGHDTYMQILFLHGAFWLRLSAQIYVDMSDFEYVAEAAKKVCEQVKAGAFMKDGHCARCVDENPEFFGSKQGS